MLDRLGRVEQSLAEIRKLPLNSRESFEAETADLLVKLAATGVAEYKGVGRSLGEHGVFDTETADLLVKLAGYRNRMVHFYHEVTTAELFGICANELQDVERIRAAYVQWMRQHPDLINDDL